MRTIGQILDDLIETAKNAGIAEISSNKEARELGQEIDTLRVELLEAIDGSDT